MLRRGGGEQVVRGNAVLTSRSSESRSVASRHPFHVVELQIIDSSVSNLVHANFSDLVAIDTTPTKKVADGENSYRLLNVVNLEIRHGNGRPVRSAASSGIPSRYVKGGLDSQAGIKPEACILE